MYAYVDLDQHHRGRLRALIRDPRSAPTSTRRSRSL